MYSVYIMIRMQVYLPTNLVTDLKNEAMLQETSMSELIRHGLKLLLNKKEIDLFSVLTGKARTKQPTNAVEEVKKLYRT